LEDTNPDKFRVFVQWLYNQTLTYIYCEEDVKIYSEDHSTGCEKETISRIELWVLAEKLLIPQLQNKAMTLLQSISEDHGARCEKETISRIELWVLAEKLLIPQLQNEAMTLLRSVGRTCIEPFEMWVDYIYYKTAKDSPLRRFVVNLIAWSAPSSEYKEYPHLYHHEFLLDLVTVFSAAVPAKTAANKRHRLDDTDYFVEERSG